MILILCSSSNMSTKQIIDAQNVQCVCHMKHVRFSMQPGVYPVGCVSTIIPYVSFIYQNTRWRGEDDIELGGGSSSSGTCRIRTVLANSFYRETLGG